MLLWHKGTIDFTKQLNIAYEVYFKWNNSILIPKTYECWNIWLLAAMHSMGKIFKKGARDFLTFKCPQHKFYEIENAYPIGLD